jgi:hypothetical protein
MADILAKIPGNKPEVVKLSKKMQKTGIVNYTKPTCRFMGI